MMCFDENGANDNGMSSINLFEKKRRLRQPTYFQQHHHNHEKVLIDHENYRESIMLNQSWWHTFRPSLKMLSERNRVDINLYHFAANLLKQSADTSWMNKHNKPSSVFMASNPYPDLPCTTSTSPCIEKRGFPSSAVSPQS
jgi:hypothetical protein